MCVFQYLISGIRPEILKHIPVDLEGLLYQFIMLVPSCQMPPRDTSGVEPVDGRFTIKNVTDTQDVQDRLQ